MTRRILLWTPLFVLFITLAYQPARGITHYANMNVAIESILEELPTIHRVAARFDVSDIRLFGAVAGTALRIAVRTSLENLEERLVDYLQRRIDEAGGQDSALSRFLQSFIDGFFYEEFVEL